MSLAALVVLAVQATPAAPSGASPAPGISVISRARADRVPVTSDDYPAAALTNGEEGVVGVVLLVNVDGRVERCHVAASSNSSGLDEEACRIMKARARFIPATNVSGRPVADFISVRVRWELARAPLPSGSLAVMNQSVDSLEIVVRGGPARSGSHPFIRARPLAPLSSLVTDRDYPPGAPRGADISRTTFVLTVAPEGNVDECRVNVSSGSAELDEIACRLTSERARFSPARDPAGQAVADSHWGRIDWANRALPPAIPPPLPRQR